MRKIVVSEFLSLDGVMQAPGGAEEDTEGGFAHGGWTHPYWHDDMGAHFVQTMSESGTLLLGRKTWQGHGAAFEHLLATLFDRRHELVRNGAADHVVDECKIVLGFVVTRAHLLEARLVRELFLALLLRLDLGRAEVQDPKTSGGHASVPLHRPLLESRPPRPRVRRVRLVLRGPLPDRWACP